MNASIFVATLAVVVQAGHVPVSWPLTTYGVDSWNGLNSWDGLKSWNGLRSWNTLNSWNHHAAYPYGVNQWFSAAAWPAFNGWYGKAEVPATTFSKVNPWGLPLASYGNGYSNYLEAAKYVTVNPESVHLAPQVRHPLNQKVIVA